MADHYNDWHQRAIVAVTVRRLITVLFIWFRITQDPYRARTNGKCAWLSICKAVYLVNKGVILFWCCSRSQTWAIDIIVYSK